MPLVVETGSIDPGHLKFAVSERFEFIVTVRVFAVLVTLPDQPIQGDPASGVAVSVTTVPAAKLVPIGFVVTVPLPVLLIVSL